MYIYIYTQLVAAPAYIDGAHDSASLQGPYTIGLQTGSETPKP